MLNLWGTTLQDVLMHIVSMLQFSKTNQKPHKDSNFKYWFIHCKLKIKIQMLNCYDLARKQYLSFLIFCQNGHIQRQCFLCFFNHISHCFKEEPWTYGINSYLSQDISSPRIGCREYLKKSRKIEKKQCKLCSNHP